MRNLPAVVAIAGVLASAAGVWGMETIDGVRVSRVSVYAAIALLAAGAAWGVHIATRVPWGICIAGVWAVACVWFVGARPLVACVLLFAAAFVLGRQCLRARSMSVNIAGGLAAIAGVGGWVLTVPVHHGAVWWAVLLALVLPCRRSLVSALSRMRWRLSSRHAAGMTLLVGLVATACWLPNVQSDDLAYHLALPTALLEDAVYRPDAAMLVWAYAPWANDTLHGIIAVLSGRVAHGALNVGWLVLLACLALQLLRTLSVRGAMAAWGTAVAVSVPMVGGLATGMHTELPATVLSLALCIVAFDARRPPAPMAVAILAGGLFALKSLHGLATGPLILFALMRSVRHANMRSVLPAVAAFFVVGASSYLRAFVATGNPVYPLGHVVDARWQLPVDWTTPFALFFDTGRYLETGQGALGVGAAALLGVACLGVRSRTLLPSCVTAAMIVLPFAAIQYARYVLPGVVCFIVVATATMHRRVPPRAASAVLASCLALHVLLWPAGNWILATRALARHVASGGDERVVLRRFLPELAVLGTIPKGARVLATNPEAPYVAMFGARGASVSWYAPALQRAALTANEDASGARWRALILDRRTEWILADDRTTSPGLANALESLGAARHATEAHAVVWRIR